MTWKALIIIKIRFKNCFECPEKQVILAKGVGDWEGERCVNENLVIVLLGDIRKAIEHHEKCWNVEKDLTDQAGERRGYGNLVNAISSDFWKAIKYHKRSLAS